MVLGGKRDSCWWLEGEGEEEEAVRGREREREDCLLCR